MVHSNNIKQKVFIVDIKTQEARSKNMAAIRCRDTKPELLLRKALFNSGLRYRINTDLIGKPDIVFPGAKLAVFVDGCFWHCCPKCYKQPENNSEFWKQKISANQKRDILVNEALTAQGWRIIRFWEHDIYNDLDFIMRKVLKLVKG
jgi:DNA mismatch endonuclease, patch repair protein